MILHGDYHTHTVYSDGIGTIEENVQSALFKGLKQIALTEHSFTHMMFGISRNDLPKYKAEIEQVREKYKDKDIDILFGIESNLINLDGDIDITMQEREMFDVLVVGYHKTYLPNSIANFFNFFLPNSYRIFKQSKKRIQKNTDAYIKAIKKYNIDIIAHLNYGGCRVDCVQIAKVAKQYGAYIELNGKRILFTDREILDMQKTGVKFIISSDAHQPKKVGKNSKAFNIIERLGIPAEQVANIDKIPTFKNYKKNN